MALVDVLAAARRGDEESFRELWRHYQPRLLRYLRVLSARDADDLASETWLQVVRELSSFRGDEHGFAAWLFTIARHRWIDLHRSQARRPAVVADLSDELLLRSPGHPAAEDVALGTLSTDAALALLSTLPVDQREAVALTVLGGLRAGEAAEILGTSPGAVRVRVHRGLRRLEAELTSEVQGLPA